MDKTASPIIYGVLGYPVKHSFSPAMHNAAFNALNLNAQYRYFQKKPQELKDFLLSLSKEQIFGVNVTVPHKESVLPFMAELSEEARLIGAVNTIKVTKKALLGFNTDGAGFLRHLGDDLKFDPRGKKVALLGAGGAAKALAVYLSIVPVESIAFFDLDRPKADGLIRQLEKIGSGVTYRVADSVEDLDIPNSHFLINATPQGMKADDPCIVKENLLHQGLLVYDLVYNPKETKLLALARQSGVACSNGLGMLLYQGALSFEIWTGQKAPIEVMRQALREVAYL